ncbi:MAG: hypothetical protein QM751_08560 [Paludibacteraceae bacterium]
MVKIETLRHQEVYERISSYCKRFAEDWASLNLVEKQEHSLIKNTKYTIKQIDDKIPIITILPAKPTSILDTINICDMLLWGELEFLAAEYDDFGIELGNYVRYFNKVFIGKYMKISPY